MGKRIKRLLICIAAAVGLAGGAVVMDSNPVAAASCTSSRITFTYPDKFQVRCTGSGYVTFAWRCQDGYGRVGPLHSSRFYTSSSGYVDRYFDCNYTYTRVYGSSISYG